MAEEQARAIGTVRDSSTLLRRLVEDVLDVSKLDSGTLEIVNRDFDVLKMLDGIATSMKAQMHYKGNSEVDFHYRCDPNVPRFITGDSDRIMQITCNLLSNASKFTERGSIYFSVDLAVGSAACLSRGCHVHGKHSSDEELGEKSRLLDSPTNRTHMLKLSVHDTGSGIPQSRIADIFEPFSKEKISDFRRLGGTGLGLSIVSRLVSNMHGKIEVVSTVGVGSTFTVFLPLCSRKETAAERCPDTPSRTPPLLPDLVARQKEPNMHSVSKGPQDAYKSKIRTLSRHNSPMTLRKALAPSPSSNMRRCMSLESMVEFTPFDFPPKSKRVLVVDDNTMNRKLLGRMLSQFNLEVDYAVNGKNAVEVMMGSRNVTGDESRPFYGLVFMDLNMPVMSGCEAIALCREAQIDTPFIALTANALPEHREEALRAGADKFVTKPIMRNVLYDNCCEYLRQPQRGN